MTGWWVAAAAIAIALVYGGYRRATDGRAQRQTALIRLDALRLGHPLGEQATLVQFSSPWCAPCRSTAGVLSGLAASTPGVRHIELDVDDHHELVDQLNITRTPTVLLLDASAVVKHRLVGATDKSELLAAVDDTLASRVL